MSRLCLDCLIHRFLCSSLFWLSAAKTRHGDPTHIRTCVRARLHVCVWVCVRLSNCGHSFAPLNNSSHQCSAVSSKNCMHSCVVLFYVAAAPQKFILALLSGFWSLISSVLLCLKAAEIQAHTSSKLSDFRGNFSTESKQQWHNFNTQTQSVCMHMCVCVFPKVTTVLPAHTYVWNTHLSVWGVLKDSKDAGVKNFLFLP